MTTKRAINYRLSKLAFPHWTGAVMGMNYTRVERDREFSKMAREARQLGYTEAQVQ